MKFLYYLLLTLPLLLAGCLSSFDEPYEPYNPTAHGDDDDDDDDTAPDDDTADDDDTVAEGPTIAITPLPVLIDPAVVNILTPGTFTIWNEGDAMLDISGISLVNDAGGILTALAWTGYIGAGESEVVSTALAAFCTAAGQQDGIMAVASNDAENPSLAVVVQVNCTDPS